MASGTARTPGPSVVSGTATSQAAEQTLTIKAVDYGFQTMGSIPGGVTTLQLQNLGKEPHQVPRRRSTRQRTKLSLLRCVAMCCDGMATAAGRVAAGWSCMFIT